MALSKAHPPFAESKRPRTFGKTREFEGNWLGRRDSNPNKQSQSLLSYR